VIIILWLNSRQRGVKLENETRGFLIFVLVQSFHVQFASSFGTS